MIYYRSSNTDRKLLITVGLNRSNYAQILLAMLIPSFVIKRNTHIQEKFNKYWWVEDRKGVMNLLVNKAR